MRLRLALLLFGLAAAQGGGSSGPGDFVLAVDTRAKPPAVGDLRLDVDGVSRSLLPSTVAVSLPPGENRKFDIWGTNGHHFSFLLVQQNGSVAVAQFTNGCQSEQAAPALTSQGQKLQIILTFRMTTLGCSISPATGAPDGRIRVRFDSHTPGAAVYYADSPSSYKAAALPSILTVAYFVNFPFSVFFKKPGYLDCGKTFRFTRAAGGLVLNLDGGQTPVTPGATVPDALVPTVSCDLSAAR